MTIDICIFWLLNHFIQVFVVRPPIARKSVLVRCKDSNLCGSALATLLVWVISVGAIMTSAPLHRDFPTIGKNYIKSRIYL